MATVLASQLQALASAETNTHFKSSIRPSILFDAKEAADIDVATIFSLALSGLEELSAMDKRFKSFKKSLFSAESSQLERELQGKEFNSKLDVSLQSFICLLSDFLLLNPAHQTLEYLIRRYKIHVYNVDDLIKYLLPYHETSLFVRIIQLSHIEKTRWHFLKGVKKSGAAPTRGLLVQQCVQDMGVLEAICESAYCLEVARKNLRSKTAISFSVAILTEVLAAVSSVEASLLNRVIPYIIRSFEKGSLVESQIGGLMIAGTLINKSNLSKETVQLICNLMAKLLHNEAGESEGSKLGQMALLIMVQVMQTQALNIFPQKAFKDVVRVRELPEIISRIDKKFNVERFLSLLISSVINHCMISPHYGQFLQEMIHRMPLKNYAESMVIDLLKLCSETLQSQDEVSKQLEICAVREVFLAIENRFPDKLDNATNLFLEQSLPGGLKGSSLTFLNSLLNNGLHSVMTASNQTIYKSLEHPKAHIRSLAVQHASVLAKDNPKMKVLCAEALLLRLHDDELSVVQSVLSVDALAELVNPDELLVCQESILSRCANLLEAGPNAEANSLGKCCLRFLALEFLKTNPSYASKVGQIFLCYMLPFSKRMWEFSLTAVRLAGHIEWGFFEGLSPIIEKMLKHNDAFEKERRRTWMHELSSSIILSLAKMLQENTIAYLLQLIACARTYERAKGIVVSIILDFLGCETEGLLPMFMEEISSFLKEEWIHMETSKDFLSIKGSTYEVLKDDFVPLDLLKLLHRDSKHTYCNLLQGCIYQFLWSVIRNKERRASFKIMEDLFSLFVSPSSSVFFEEHLRLLLKNLSMPRVLFLSRFLNSEQNFPQLVQVYSVNLLVADIGHKKDYDATELQLALPCLLAGLASAVKAVRKAASESLARLYDIWKDTSTVQFGENGSEEHSIYLAHAVCKKFLKLLLEYRSSFVSSRNFLTSFLTSTLGHSTGANENTEETPLMHRLSETAQKSILVFLLRSAVKMPVQIQCTLVVALNGAGHLADQALETKGLLDSLLSRWREWRTCGLSKLSSVEVELLRHLLKVHMHAEGVHSLVHQDVTVRTSWFQILLEVTDVDENVADPDTIEIACEALNCLEKGALKSLPVKSQDAVFDRILQLSKMNTQQFQTVCQCTLQRIQVDDLVVVRYIDRVLNQLPDLKQEPQVNQENAFTVISSLSAVLEFLISKNSIEGRNLVKSLFDILGNLFKLPVICNDEMHVGAHIGGTSTLSTRVFYVQQLTLEILERIARSLTQENGSVAESYDIDFLVEFIHGTTDTATRNQALIFLSVLGGGHPDLVLQHVISVFSVLGETTLIHDDSHSYIVTEKLISAVVPGWLEKMKDPRLLLQIFVKALPQIPSHRRTPLLKTALRLMKESTSLHVLLLLLLQYSLHKADKPSNKRLKDGKKSSTIEVDLQIWFEDFSSTICEQYGPSIWFPALLNLVKDAQLEAFTVNMHGHSDQDRSWKLLVKAVEFTLCQLQKNAFSIQLKEIQNESTVKEAFLGLLEEVLALLERINNDSHKQRKIISKLKPILEDNASQLLECVTSLMSPILFAESTIHILQSRNKNLKVRVLRLVAGKMQDNAEELQSLKAIQVTEDNSNSSSAEALRAYERLVEAIGGLLGHPEEETSDLTLAAILALRNCSQGLAKSLHPVFISNLQLLISNYLQSTPAAPAALHCIAAIISEIGPLSLPVLMELVRGVLGMAKLLQRNGTMSGTTFKASDLAMAVLTVLETVLLNLGNFLSPYLDDILNLMLVEPVFLSNTNKNVSRKADIVREHVPRVIPVRLLLDPLVAIYDKTLARGEGSLQACVDVFSSLVTTMDRSSVLSHHKKIFQLCLLAFDLRRSPPKCFRSITTVEMSVISLFSGLVLKLSESTFKPLFVRLLEWVEADISNDPIIGRTRNVHRSIVFYKVVNQLADKLRSVFVPYFQYLLKGCVYHLTSVQDIGRVKPSKKQKVSSGVATVCLSDEDWHLRQLVISSLHKCFLYDNVNFLEAQKFQMLLGPIVRQISVERGSPVKDAGMTSEWIPSTADMEDALVNCLGQMAITAGTDLLWKPLNHEVLLCTRSDVVRVRLLSLRIVKTLVEHLKEDYLVLLPETIPFLAELLEDQELDVVSKSQEIIKLLEELSGESLSQYL